MADTILILKEAFLLKENKGENFKVKLLLYTWKHWISSQSLAFT